MNYMYYVVSQLCSYINCIMHALFMDFEAYILIGGGEGKLEVLFPNHTHTDESLATTTLNEHA